MHCWKIVRSGDQDFRRSETLPHDTNRAFEVCAGPAHLKSGTIHESREGIDREVIEVFTHGNEAKGGKKATFDAQCGTENVASEQEMWMLQEPTEEGVARPVIAGRISPDLWRHLGVKPAAF